MRGEKSSQAVAIDATLAKTVVLTVVSLLPKVHFGREHTDPPPCRHLPMPLGPLLQRQLHPLQ